MLERKTCWEIVENKIILENYLLRFYTTLRSLLCGEISIAIVCSSGFIAVVAKRSPWLQCVVVAL